LPFCCCWIAARLLYGGQAKWSDSTLQAAWMDAGTFLDVYEFVETLLINKVPQCACAPSAQSLRSSAVRQEKFLELGFAPTGPVTSIAALLREHCQSHTIQSDSPVDRCSVCATPFSIRHRRQFTDITGLDVFAVSLRRGCTGYQKNFRRVNLDSIISVGPCMYVLRAVAVHLGMSGSMGHYLTWVRDLRGYVIATAFRSLTGHVQQVTGFT
jgi:hypothetical protein